MRLLAVTALALCVAMMVGCQKKNRTRTMSRVPTVTTVHVDGNRAAPVGPVAVEAAPSASGAAYGDSPYITLPSASEPGSASAVPSSAYSSSASIAPEPIESPSYTTPSTSYSTAPVPVTSEPVYGGSNTGTAYSSETVLPVFTPGETTATPTPAATFETASTPTPVYTSQPYTASTPTATYSPAPAPSAVSGGTTYIVQKGDTLWSIARRHYGDGRRWTDIAAANNITNAKGLSIGQRLQIP